MEQTSTQNIVSLEPENYIFVALIGDQDYRSIEEVAKRARKLADNLQAEGKPILGVIDSSRHGSFNAGSNKAAMQALDVIPYRRVAMCGNSKILTGVAQMIIAALGKGDYTKLFETREEAVAWVLNEPVVPLP